MNWPFRKHSNPARELAKLGIEKRKADVRAVARQIREELGMPPSQALGR